MIKQITRETGMFMSMSARPGNFGVRFFNYLFGELELNYIYRAVSPTNLEDALKGMRALKIRGSALSMPFKEEALALVDEVDAAAREIGAINTVVNDDGKLTGYNTDYLGVRHCLSNCAAANNVRVALLGSGGMARAIAYALHGLGYRDVTVVARNERARGELAKQFKFLHSDKVPTGSHFLINATPVGMRPDPLETMSFDAQAIAASKHIMESIAEPIDTGLVRAAVDQRKEIINGFDIILNQAKAQFELYFPGQKLDEDLARRAAEHARNI